MLRRKKSRKRKRKKTFKRQRDPFLAAMGSRISPMPTKFRTTLLYTDQITLNPGAGGLRSSNIFRCNSLFDPDATNLGHQPRGFDELMFMYEHYVVIAVVIKATFMPQIANERARCCIQVNGSPTPLTTFNDYAESGTATVKFLSTTSSPTAVIISAVNPNKFLSRSSPLSDPDLKGDATTGSGTNPLEQCFWHVVAGGVGGVDTGLIDVQIQILYTAIFLEPVTANQS